MKNLLEYLYTSAEKHPDKIAFFDDTESISFKRLLEMTKSAGAALNKKLRYTKRPVPVLIDRTARSVVLMLAVLESGNFYVPIDAKMPQGRALSILEQINADCIFYSAGCEKVTDNFSNINKICLEDCLEYEADDTLLAEIRSRSIDLDPAYVIFTSGSTGKPKGIVVSHRSVIDFTEWLAEFCGYDDSAVFGNQAPFYFDLSVKDLYQTIKHGASCYIIPRQDFSFPNVLLEKLNNNGINSLNWATSAFNLVANSGLLEKHPLERVKTITVGGEALHPKQVNLWVDSMPDVRIYNLYGPTETTVDCTGYMLERRYGEGEIIPIGKACDNMQIILLDENQHEAVKGAVGEICVRGTGIALGYFPNEAKNRECFTQNPLNPDYPDIIYRTGDLGRENPDGYIEFVSRRDHQIKHMGYRIELGEIEVALYSVDGLDECICFLDRELDRIICLYSGEIEVNPLAKKMRGLLPSYMLPNKYRRREKLPQNANGKIDRKLLESEYNDDKNSKH